MVLGPSDGKEYDIYVSYARNAEEEEFVLLTLRGVLENEFGYKLCIFDRDSLPGGSEYLPRRPPTLLSLLFLSCLQPAVPRKSSGAICCHPRSVCL